MPKICADYTDDAALMGEIGVLTGELLSVTPDCDADTMSTLLTQASCLLDMALRNVQETRAIVNTDTAQKLYRQQRILGEAISMYNYAETKTKAVIGHIELKS